ncbi:MAG: Archaeal Lon protease [Methanomethylovorans sp. PtaU1.Bin093]|uniref:S16 family serine protease n=1 Tax=Methanomethylovorans sp. PtaU1.Bin093 TaxID=1811679 RepID=UPI0009D139B0|nr:S16 family serine protease [Methanomethylovorans sp. PtaU1.Bin093]OPY19890.1 MAG: Archaeal Lon protease [Methanomethylovorans sp. PtaU1.Bin093]
MRKGAMILLLIISLTANLYLLAVQQPVKDEQVQLLQEQINSLEAENEVLDAQISQDNVSLQSYASQVDFYRQQVNELRASMGLSADGYEGSASLQAPAVYQSVEEVIDGPFIRQIVTEKGSLMNISVEVDQGKGRVLVETKPLMGVVFQDAANTAVFVAQNMTGANLMVSDTIFSITAPGEVPAVDGPSAGALMTLIMISAINNEQLNDSITLTGTIDQYGHIGEIGGVLEKAQAAKDGGKQLLLLPQENSQLVQYTYAEKNIGGFSIIERRPVIIDAKPYIEENIGIRVEYVDSIEDIMYYAFDGPKSNAP